MHSPALYCVLAAITYGPVAYCFFAAGVFWGLYDILWHRDPRSQPPPPPPLPEARNLSERIALGLLRFAMVLSGCQGRRPKRSTYLLAWLCLFACLAGLALAILSDLGILR